MDVIKKGGAAGEGKRFVPAHVTHDAYVAMLHEKYDPKNTKAAKEQAAKEHVRTHACASQILGQSRLLTMERVSALVCAGGAILPHYGLGGCSHAIAWQVPV